MDEQAGRVLGGEGVIGCPLVEDQQNEVAKQARHKNNLWDEAQEDVQRLLEVPAVQGYQLATQTRQVTCNVSDGESSVECVSSNVSLC